MVNEPVVGKVYKGINGDEYRVTAIADYTEEQIRLVIYVSDGSKGNAVACPVREFWSMVIENPARSDNDTICEDYLSKKDEIGNLEPDGDSENVGDSEPGGIDPLLERFLDAESYEKKLECFYLMRNKADLRMLNNVAMSLDIELSKENVEEQYDEIMYCLKTMEKYECNRLRP